ncbi:hypothetical protein SESBI_27333 [Sesbania bispinosa]|nr:hypothetical protein SESBI_27333 [Sesbania bispinosa]
MKPLAPPLLNRVAMAPLLLCSSTESNRTSQVTITPVSARTGDLHVVTAQTHLSTVAAARNDPSTVVVTQIRRASHQSASEQCHCPLPHCLAPRQPPYVAISPGRRRHRHLHNPSSITLKP